MQEPSGVKEHIAHRGNAVQSKTELSEPCVLRMSETGFIRNLLVSKIHEPHGAYSRLLTRKNSQVSSV
jgi:hypothetical protein